MQEQGEAENAAAVAPATERGREADAPDSTATSDRTTASGDGRPRAKDMSDTTSTREGAGAHEAARDSDDAHDEDGDEGEDGDESDASDNAQAVDGQAPKKRRRRRRRRKKPTDGEATAASSTGENADAAEGSSTPADGQPASELPQAPSHRQGPAGSQPEGDRPRRQRPPRDASSGQPSEGRSDAADPRAGRGGPRPDERGQRRPHPDGEHRGPRPGSERGGPRPHSGAGPVGGGTNERDRGNPRAADRGAPRGHDRPRDGFRDGPRGGGPRDRSRDFGGRGGGPRDRDQVRIDPRPGEAGSLRASLFSHLLDGDRFKDVGDTEVPCRKPGCNNTWTWTREARAAARLRGGDETPPRRLCQSCFEEERYASDMEVPCRVKSCKRTWTWTRDAQQRHQAWYRREVEKANRAQAAATERANEPGAGATSGSEPSDAAAHLDSSQDQGAGTAAGAAAAAEARTGKSGGRSRKRRRDHESALHEGPPSRLCRLCAGFVATLKPLEQPCKVHGCGKTWTWGRDAQLEDWAALGTDDLSRHPAAPKRICRSCRDFCRAHPDREMACGKAGCERTWSYKTGAQLQDSLAGRTLQPLRLACSIGKRHRDCPNLVIAPPPAAHLKLPPGSEIMPCTVPACEGTWVWSPGMQLRPAAEGEPAVDRMCDSCRGKHDEPARDPRPALALAHAESSEDGNAASVPAETPHDVVADGGLELSEDDLSDRDHATDDHAQAVHEVDYDAHHDDEGASSEDGAEPATSPQDGPHGDPEPSATPEATAGDDEPSTDS